MLDGISSITFCKQFRPSTSWFRHSVVACNRLVTGGLNGEFIEIVCLPNLGGIGAEGGGLLY